MAEHVALGVLGHLGAEVGAKAEVAHGLPFAIEIVEREVSQEDESATVGELAPDVRHDLAESGQGEAFLGKVDHVDAGAPCGGDGLDQLRPFGVRQSIAPVLRATNGFRQPACRVDDRFPWRGHTPVSRGEGPKITHR